MNKSKTVALITLIIFTFGCFAAEEIPITPVSEDPNILLITEEHPDIYLPPDTRWERTLYSGTIEQHELFADLDWEEIKTEMESFEWILKEEGASTLRFTKDNVLVTYSQQGSKFILFIEPADLYY